MKVLKNMSVEQGIALHINERVAALLRQERLLKGRSIRTVARKLKIKRASLMRWEAGTVSPPANIFYKIICFYGKAAYWRAAELDFQLQQEKYNRALLENQTKEAQHEKIPAVIWAEESSFRAAA